MNPNQRKDKIKRRKKKKLVESRDQSITNPRQTIKKIGAQFPT
jgi:hypothetical protein